MIELSVQEELHLVEQAKKDIVVFEKLYDLYFQSIFSYCRNRLPNRESAEDVTSIVFLKAVEAIKNFDTRKGIRFGSWLYRTAHNAIIDYLKKQKVHLFLSVEDAEELPEIAVDVEDPAISQEHRIKVFTVLTLLHERYQHILSLKFFEEMDNPEIASIMQIKPTQVSVLLYRALQDFRKKFLERYPSTDIFSLDNRFIK